MFLETGGAVSVVCGYNGGRMGRTGGAVMASAVRPRHGGRIGVWTSEVDVDDRVGVSGGFM
jgi:hypothetical protein